jgi:hypothetical protein
MKKILILIILLLNNLCYSQNGLERNYLYEKNKVLKVQIYEVTYSDFKVDSVLKMLCFYDTLGRLIEKRFDYNKLNTKYVSYIYEYDKKGGYSFVIDNPYVLYSVSFKNDSLKKKLIYYDKKINRINYEIIEFQNECKKQRVDYIYNSEGLLVEIIKSINGKVISKDVYFYYKRSNVTTH